MIICSIKRICIAQLGAFPSISMTNLPHQTILKELDFVNINHEDYDIMSPEIFASNYFKRLSALSAYNTLLVTSNSENYENYQTIPFKLQMDRR